MGACICFYDIRIFKGLFSLIEAILRKGSIIYKATLFLLLLPGGSPTRSAFFWPRKDARNSCLCYVVAAGQANIHQHLSRGPRNPLWSSKETSQARGS